MANGWFGYLLAEKSHLYFICYELYTYLAYLVYINHLLTRLH